MIDLYVYYKVRSVDAPRLAALVRAMQEGLATHEGVRGQLKRRPEEKDGLQTWMEIYPDVADGVADLVARAALKAGFEGLIEGPRRAEIFTDLPPCA